MNIVCLSGCPGLALPSLWGFAVEGLTGRTDVMVHVFYAFGKGRLGKGRLSVGRFFAGVNAGDVDESGQIATLPRVCAFLDRVAALWFTSSEVSYQVV